MKNYFIINPAAGSGKKIKALVERIETACNKRSLDFEIYLTQKAGDATDFVKSKCENALENIRFFACGGDGTINEVASGAAEFDCASVGLVPAGTGNDFLRCFEGKEFFHDIEAQLDSMEEKVDIIRCNDRYVINMFNTGFDCEVAAKASELKHLPGVSSSLAYILGVVAKFIKKPGAKLSVSVDGGEFEDKDLLLATVSNGRFCGGGFKAAPRARLADGEMDVCFISNISRRKFISIVGKYRSGEYIDMEKLQNIIEYRRAKQVEICFKAPQNICLDGEIISADRIRLSIIPKRLSILVPKGAKFTENESESVETAAEVKA